MCFFRQPSMPQPTQAATPAPAPPPPEPIPEETTIGARRREEDRVAHGDQRGPRTRVDRSVSAGGVGAGGTGIRI